MKKITEEELKEILEQHRLWLCSDEKEGKRADLKDADLSGANLTRANLRFAVLTSANLTGANLTGVNLYYANLIGANLTRANLTNAYLYYANLAYANLTDANLSYANLTYANLTGADLTGANLTGANLTGANLTGAILRHANLSGVDLIKSELEYADLTDTILDENEQCRKGIVLTEPMIGYKKASGGKIITLEILVGAKVFSINNSKRRASKVKVIDMQGETELSSIHDNDFKYHVGDEIEITNFDENYNVECSTGIHFFLTRDEAEKY